MRQIIATTTRSDLGVVTSDGRVLRVHAADVPLASVSSASPTMDEFIGASGPLISVGLIDLSSPEPFALGTSQGVVKRVNADYPKSDEFEVIKLRPADRVVGISYASDQADLVFITLGAQILRFSAATVRPQGRLGSGVTGISLSQGDSVIWFGAVIEPDQANVCTIANSSASLAGTDPGSYKVTPMRDVPKKGRATGGVRIHKFLKNENQLAKGYASDFPINLIGPKEKQIRVSERISKRDASGEALTEVCVAFGFPADSAKHTN